MKAKKMGEGADGELNLSPTPEKATGWLKGFFDVRLEGIEIVVGVFNFVGDSLHGFLFHGPEVFIFLCFIPEAADDHTKEHTAFA